MSVHDATTTPALFNNPPRSLLSIRTDVYAGRKYHATTALPENADLLGSCVPFSYTLWKRFRNEVCAECWRYDGGRRTFLTRRDDEDLGERVASAEPHIAFRGPKPISTVGAGLWFCDTICQQRWIAREGADAVSLLRQLEGARRKSIRNKQSVLHEQDDDGKEKKITQETVDRAWNVVYEQERLSKEVRKWRQIQLDDYETDMARYVLLALLRQHRERHAQASQYRPADTRTESSSQSCSSTDWEKAHECSGWSEFSSLQSNELFLLRSCPEILEHQTRIYQLLKGRFGHSSVATVPPSVPSSRSHPLSASSPPCLARWTTGVSTPHEKQASCDSEVQNKNLELGRVITIAGVRTALGIDPGNSFGVWEVPLTDESECLGFAVYPIASFFNHHCSPNVRKEREGRTLRFLTARNVEEGEELCISYGHVESMDWATRQKELLEGWYFRCRCGRCESEKPVGSAVVHT